MYIGMCIYIYIYMCIYIYICMYIGMHTHTHIYIYIYIIYLSIYLSIYIYIYTRVYGVSKQPHPGMVISHPSVEGHQAIGRWHIQPPALGILDLEGTVGIRHLGSVEVSGFQCLTFL